MKKVTYIGPAHYREVTLGPLLQLEEDDERVDTVLRWDRDNPTLEVDDDVAEVLPLRTSKKEWVIEGVETSDEAAWIAQTRVQKAEAKQQLLEEQQQAVDESPDDGNDSESVEDDSEDDEN
jgi:hypothetical protein